MTNPLIAALAVFFIVTIVLLLLADKFKVKTELDVYEELKEYVNTHLGSFTPPYLCYYLERYMYDTGSNFLPEYRTKPYESVYFKLKTFLNGRLVLESQYSYEEFPDLGFIEHSKAIRLDYINKQIEIIKEQENEL